MKKVNDSTVSMLKMTGIRVLASFYILKNSVSISVFEINMSRSDAK